MGEMRRGSGAWRRATFVIAFAYVFALQSIASAIAFSCPSDDGLAALDAALAAAICQHADDGATPASHHHAPAPLHVHHCCLFCAAHAAHAARGAATLVAAPALPPPPAAIGVALADNAPATLHPGSGRATSWSPRAPPFDA